MDFKRLQNYSLFAGIDPDKIPALLSCLGSRQQKCVGGEFLHHAGDRTEEMGLVLSGSVYILREDFWGNRRILGKIHQGDLFGEAFACSGEKMTVSVQASESSFILYLNCTKLMETCTKACDFHAHILAALIRILAQKNQKLVVKMEHMSQKTTREKLLSYLSEQAQLTGKQEFVIPFNRQQLADYLSVERSAMSAELSRMRQDGILDFERSRFCLYRQEERFMP